MEYYQKPGLRKYRYVLYGLVILLVAGCWLWLISREQARARDVRRIADVLVIQSAFERMYGHDRSYAAAAVKGCDTAGQVVSTCKLKAYERTFDTIADPGRYDYVISRVPDETDYGVTFRLEIGHTDLPKGEHTLSAGGIH